MMCATAAQDGKGYLKPNTVSLSQAMPRSNTEPPELTSIVFNYRVSLAENFRRRQKFDEVSFVFPNAPSIPITVVRFLPPYELGCSTSPSQQSATTADLVLFPD